VALVVAARKGDPAAFARIIEHWNPHLRPFVHHILAGEGSTDRALSAAYVRAYRALPRYRAERKPGLWLHRIAYLAATDELRRVRRDPARRRALADAGRTDADHDEIDLTDDTWADRPGGLQLSIDDHSPADAEPESAIIEARNLIELAGGTVPDTTFPPGWRRLAPDQRALAVMVDLEDYRVDDAAAALDAGVEPATNRLSSARRLLARDRTNSVGFEPTGTPETDALVAAARATLAEIPIPPADPDFWSMLGRRLLAERDAPAVPSIDPMARLAKAHPAEPGFKPNKHLRPLPGDPGYDPVQGLADQADRAKPRRPWRRVGIIAAVLVVVAACVGVAVWVGTSERIPDGSRAASELAGPVGTAMAAGPYRQVSTIVTEGDSAGGTDERQVDLTVANDGSWAVTETGVIDQTTYDSSAGLVRRVAVIGTGEDADVVAADTEGLSAGAPDPAPTLPTPLSEISLVPSLFRLADDQRVSRTTIPRDLGRSVDDSDDETDTDGAESNEGADEDSDDLTVWRLTHDLPSGDQGEEERWTVLVDSNTSLPVQIERTQGERLVRRITVVGWETVTEVPGDAFAQPVPDDVTPSVVSSGFISTELAAVPLLGRGEAVTPGWLPEGFDLEVVAVRADPPAGASGTAGGANPADEDVLSLGFQRGPERITVTTRAAGSDHAAWQSPFAAPLVDPRERTLGDGRFNGARAEAGIDLYGRAQLWLVSGDTVLTVSGDLTVDDAFRLATSLR